MRTKHRSQVTEMVVRPADQKPSTRHPETVVKLTEEGDAVYVFQPFDNTGEQGITITRDNWEQIADAVDSLFEGIPVPVVDDPTEPLKASYEQPTEQVQMLVRWQCGGCYNYTSSLCQSEWYQVKCQHCWRSSVVDKFGNSL